MVNQAIRHDGVMERKIISVSIRRQLTIPQKYFEALGFDNEAECILQDGGLFIRPVRGVRSDFSEQILTDLISQGYNGQELLQKFKEYSNAIRPAVSKLINEADTLAESGEGRVPIDELFGTEV
jgi:bifunctional DNA-binding transcriptional regulator/antitoxin component of YhaV-PrlF toxin-antitoxin module